MSELKARLLGQTMNEYGCDTKIYLKSEADKVIAEKDEEIDKQKWRGDEWAKACNQKDKKIAELKEKYNELAKLHDKAIQACCDADKVIRHHKYNRCLDKAKWCESEEKRLEAISPIFDNDKEFWEYNSDYWGKWHDYWLCIGCQKEMEETYKDVLNKPLTAQQGKG